MMGALNHSMGGALALPINLLGQAKRWLSRAEQEDLIERLLQHIDTLDGDIDLEPNGDELDGSLGEDDFHQSSYSWRGEPGCPIADPDLAVDDSPCDEPYQDLEPEMTI